jgi:hypothetical protein
LAVEPGAKGFCSAAGEAPTHLEVGRAQGMKSIRSKARGVRKDDGSAPPWNYPRDRPELSGKPRALMLRCAQILSCRVEQAGAAEQYPPAAAADLAPKPGRANPCQEQGADPVLILVIL